MRLHIKIFAISFFWASSFILIKLLVYVIGRKKIEFPDFFSWKSLFFEIIVLTVVCNTFFFLINNFFEQKTQTLYVHLFILFFISIVRFYSFAIEPIIVFTNKKIIRDINVEDKYKKILNGIRVYRYKGNLSNAYAIGVLNFAKGIIISQDLVDKMSSYELSGIIGHEVGHLKKKHLFKLYLSTIFAILLGYTLFMYYSPYIESLNYNIHLLRGLFGGIFYGLPLWLIPSLYQRKLELEADEYSAQLTSKDCIISSLKKLDTITRGAVSKGGDTHPKLKYRINNVLRS